MLSIVCTGRTFVPTAHTSPAGRTLASRRFARRGELAGVGILPAAAIAVCRCLHFFASRKIAIQSKVRRGNGFQGFPNQLDYGLYFFGCGDECQKYIDCEDNIHFSRDKDTLVYVHGWEVDRVGQLYRETFNWKKNEPRCGLDVDLARAWLDNGWNVAVFYWDMFADEPWLPDAEAKIWTARGRRRMRYRLASGTFQEADSPSHSASSLLGKILYSLVQASPKKQLRLAGHSLGAPLVIAAASNMFEQQGMPCGVRIALLDPYWSCRVQVLNSQDYLASAEAGSQMIRGKGTTGSLSLALALMLARNDVLFEIYYSCPTMTQMPIVADNSTAEELVRRKLAALVQYDASCCDPWDLEAQHLLAPNLYLYSMQHPAPGCGAPSASASDEVLAMARGQRWQRPGLAL
ncbi:unnamed protein product [Symbiodinium sp. CCMP2592]|nr:unnamed protein product [Symbiodinium sp. CCMP2592]